VGGTAARAGVGAQGAGSPTRAAVGAAAATAAGRAGAAGTLGAVGAAGTTGGVRVGVVGAVAGAIDTAQVTIRIRRRRDGAHLLCERLDQCVSGWWLVVRCYGIWHIG
jgi:hypothetical protein